VLEGYGVTEAAPVLSINLPMRNEPGSAGRFLPGIEWRLVPVEGVPEGGRLWVKGPNVMLGYLRASAPGVLEPPEDGWYDTGDIVDVDAAGFVWIKDRAKRFAKIGGEMVSMTVGEALAHSVWPDDTHAVVALADARKGERLMLVTSRAATDLQELLQAAQAQGIPEIMVPRVIHSVPHMPRLGSGKVDYAEVQRIAEAETSQVMTMLSS
jgi:acyl-[acyl-carrier-protein]-phospholipid O-acyltransferase/long-chain-fatty-acid--[acyl-carrier-protein] ligase